MAWLCCLVLILAFQLSQSSCAQIVVYSASFEEGTSNPGFYTYIRSCSPTPCDQPVASVDSSSADAARDGGVGVRIDARQASTHSWLVHFNSPSTLLAPSRLYTYCLWARLGPATPAATASVSTNINLVAADTGQWITGTPAATGPNPTPNSVTITRAWQRFCLREVQVPAATNAYFALALGGAAAEYHLDDASLEWQALDPGWADPARAAAAPPSFARARALRAGPAPTTTRSGTFFGVPLQALGAGDAETQVIQSPPPPSPPPIAAPPGSSNRPGSPPPPPSAAPAASPPPSAVPAGTGAGNSVASNAKPNSAPAPSGPGAAAPADGGGGGDDSLPFGAYIGIGIGGVLLVGALGVALFVLQRRSARVAPAPEVVRVAPAAARGPAPAPAVIRAAPAAARGPAPAPAVIRAAPAAARGPAPAPAVIRAAPAAARGPAPAPAVIRAAPAAARGPAPAPAVIRAALAAARGPAPAPAVIQVAPAAARSPAAT